MTEILSDQEIEFYCTDNNNPMIKPFWPYQVRQINGRRVISFGLSSYGYDICLDTQFKVFTNTQFTVIDPKNFDEKCFINAEVELSDDPTDPLDNAVIVPPNSFVLGQSLEYFKIPRDVITICIGKSTYARCGIIVNVTPFEPEWEGHATLEISNTTPLPAKIYALEGIAQVLFFKNEEPCRVSYKDRKGRYDKQERITLPNV